MSCQVEIDVARMKNLIYPRQRLFLIWLVSMLCSSGAVSGSVPQVGETRVLFVGNSLSEANDLPQMVESLAKATGRCNLRVKSRTLPNASLEDHWNEGSAVRTIQKDHWDYVVLQQGPSSLPDSRTHLIHWTREFSRIARRAGATPALYMIWPSKDRSGDFERVRDSYKLASESVDGLFLPAGEAWRVAWGLDANLRLYGPDGFHPTAEGSYLAALVIVGALCNCSTAGLPAEIHFTAFHSISIAAASLLQKAADLTVARFRIPSCKKSSKWRFGYPFHNRVELLVSY